jgi:hypothetical protein
MFLDAATYCASFGFRIFPLVPKKKSPFKMAGGDHFDAATTDLELIKEWAAQAPSANVGLCPDEHFCFLETDDDAALRDKCKDLPPEVWETMRVSARENRCYYVFRTTTRVSKAGNMTVARKGENNLFELKVHRVYVAGPGSVHPTGAIYEATEHTIPAMPDVLLSRLCELYGAPDATKTAAMSAETKQQTELLDRFLEYYEVPSAGDWFNKGKQWFRPIECPWADAHENVSGETSSCIVYIEGDGFGFDCKHRCSEKDWKTFRAKLESTFPDKPKFAFLAPGPKVVVGRVQGPRPVSRDDPAAGSRSDDRQGSGQDTWLGRETKEPVPDDAAEEVEDVAAGERALYPIGAWRGTLLEEYCDLCGDGNFIPKKFFAEALLSHIRAIVGTQVQSRVGGALSHSYTVFISVTQSGKGVSIEERPNQLFWCEGESTTLKITIPLIWNADDLINRRASGIGAELRTPATAQGVMTDFDPTGKRAKRSEASGKWKGIPRIFIRAEEMGELLGSMEDEQTGRALGSMFNKLYDRYDFAGTSTTKRVPYSGKMVLNILGGITPTEWTSIMQNCRTARTGFFNRLTIIGSEGCKRAILKVPDLADFRRRLYAKLHSVEEHAVCLEIDSKASDALLQWMDATEAAHPNDRDLLARFNVHVLRPALMRAWLLDHQTIELGDILACIPLGDSQLKMREFFFPQEGEGTHAQAENLLLHTAQMRGRITKRELFHITSVYKTYGTQVASQAFANLLKRRAVRIETDTKKTLRKWVIALKDKD